VDHIRHRRSREHGSERCVREGDPLALITTQVCHELIHAEEMQRSGQRDQADRRELQPAGVRLDLNEPAAGDVGTLCWLKDVWAS
jgi:hypothetical protein